MAGWNRLKHHGRRIGSWGWKAIAAILFLLGLGQIPDEVSVWERWISAVKADPQVYALAVKLAGIGAFLDLWWVDTALILLALVILFWGSRPFWRTRHKAIYLMRHSLSEQVWISKDVAMNLVRQSRWARMRRSSAEPPRDRISLFSANMLTTDPAKEARDVRFYRWCERALDGFGKHNSEALRDISGKPEYDEVRLKEYLEEKFDEDVVADFGSPF